MNCSYISQIRQLALNGMVRLKKHAINRCFERDICHRDIIDVLTSNTNAIVETQKATDESPDERILIYDHQNPKEIVIVLMIDFVTIPTLRIITVEFVDNNIWDKRSEPPWLKRK